MDTTKVTLPTSEEIFNIKSFLTFIDKNKDANIEHLIDEALKAGNSEFALAWAILYKKERVEKVENYIADKIKSEGKDLTDYTKTIALTYVKNFPDKVKEGKLFEAILNQAEMCLIIAMYAIQGRFIEGEVEIMKDEVIRDSYINYLKLLNINSDTLGGSN